MSREEIIAANPIVDFVRNRGRELKPAGQNFVTNACPQTQHKRGHPPVMIYPETQSWSCHDCKVGGTVIDWVMHEKDVTAAGAMRELAGGLNGSDPVASLVKTSPSQASKAPAANDNVTFDWSNNCVAPLTPKELIRLGNERWYSRQFCIWLHDKKYVGLVHGDFALYVEGLRASLPCTPRAKPSKKCSGDGKGVTIFHLGDYDPSRHAAADAIERTFRETFDCSVNFERIAILPEHIAQFSLPTRPTKQSDSRARNWRGSECVELDSMPSAQLRGLVEGAITSLIDSYEWEKLKEIEQEELATLSATVAGFTASDGGSDDDLLIPF